MPIFVEWWPEHLVDDPTQMILNQAWAEKIYSLLRDGGFVVTDHGAYVKRDGGLHQMHVEKEGSNGLS